MKYKGSCHCQAVQFEFESVPITEGLQCNCSICIRKNAIMSLNYIESADFILIKGQDSMSTYRWGDQVVNHYFCQCCGIYPFHDVIDGTEKFRVNFGCVEGIDLKALKLTEFDGKDLL